MADNKLVNGSFEDGWYEWGGFDNLRVPIGWSFWHADESIVNEWDVNRHPFVKPEAHVLALTDFPEFERDGRYVVDGTHCWKCFKRNGSIWIVLWQRLNLDAGLHKFTACINANLIDRMENGQKVAAADPESGQIRLGYSGKFSNWRTMQQGDPPTYLTMNRYEWEFEVAAPGEIDVGVEIRLAHPLLNNGFFADAFSLERVADPPPPARTYHRTVHLLPQDTTDAELAQVIEVAAPEKQTITWSADDAVIDHPNLKSRTVHAWDAGRIGGSVAKLEAWIKENYPPLPTLVYHKFETGPPPPSWEQHLLWQCDPLWANKKFGSAGYKTTICKEGCYLTNLAMASLIMGNEPTVTPALIVDWLNESDYRPGTAEVLWTSVEKKLDIKIQGTIGGKPIIPVDIRRHLAAGGLALVEVLPKTLQHFVLVVEAQGDDWMILDPKRNVVDLLSKQYAGAESFRLLSKAGASPPPPPPPPPVVPIAQPLSLHIQTEVEGWEYFVETVKPSWVKVFNTGTAGQVKRLSPNTKVLYRHHVDHQAPFLENPNPTVAAQQFLDLFSDVLSNPNVDAIEGLNETIGTGDTDGIKRAVAFEVALSNIVASRGDAVSVCLLNTAVGNPDEKELHLLRPAAEAAVRNKHYIGYHPYWPCAPLHSLRWYEAEGEYHHFRFVKWDDYFKSVGLRPKYLLTEMGAVAATIRGDGRPGSYNSGAGWRHPDCLNGDWLVYKSMLVRFRNDLRKLNAINDNRFEGAMAFTVGEKHVGWDLFKLWKDELQNLADALR